MLRSGGRVWRGVWVRKGNGGGEEGGGGKDRGTRQLKLDSSAHLTESLGWSVSWLVGSLVSRPPPHYGSEQPEYGTSKFTLSHELGSE